MKRIFQFLCLTLLFSSSYSSVLATDAKPDTVKAGIYITNIYDIDFKQREYSIELWLWLKYKRREFDFVQNLEIPQAKTINKSFSTMDSSIGMYYLLMKLQCVMKDSWKITNFPFDYQRLRFSIENSQFDTKDLVFQLDTLGKPYDPHFVLKGWEIDSFKLSSGLRTYETNFGDPTVTKQHEEYSSFKVKMGIKRNAMDLFWKLFIGMYMSFLICYLCFYIHADNIDSRFGLSVGALFAAIGNKYIIEASLPESTSFTLVDTLHGITLFYIFVVVASSAYSLNLVKKDKLKFANKFDFIFAQFILVSYVLINFWLINTALKSV